jgi:hypothetical protein
MLQPAPSLLLLSREASHWHQPTNPARAACRRRRRAAGAYDRLGLGDCADRLEPTPLCTRAPPATAAAAGFGHTLLLARDGVVWAWGGNAFGELGLGDDAPRAGPCAVEWEMPPVGAVACGEHHSLAVTVEGTLYAWGQGAFGQLGLGRDDDHALPVPLLRLARPPPTPPPAVGPATARHAPSTPHPGRGRDPG